MSRTQNDKDKGFIAALITAFGDSDQPPTRSEIEAKAAMLAPILQAPA